MFGQLESLFLGLLNYLGVPPGVTVRRYYGDIDNEQGRAARGAANLAKFEFIQTIVDITADDVCIGATPFYLDNQDEVLSPVLQESYVHLVAALNSIAKWAAVDLLEKGVSIYALQTEKTQISELGDSGQKLTREIEIPHLVPVISDNVKFYMKSDGGVVTLINGKEATSHLIFLKYSKKSLSLIKEDDKMRQEALKGYLYEIQPEPIQLKNVAGIASDLYKVERAMYTYRMQLAKIVRFAEVEIGPNYGGENNQDAIDNAAAAVNANSMSMSAYQTDASQIFDDNIPIVPLRKGTGSIEVKSDIPDFSLLKEMPDLEYTLNKLFLGLRFPKSYADFNQALSETAVSLLRGDIRYSRMVDDCRSLLQDTVNKWIFSPVFDAVSARTQVKLTALPNSEDDDVIDALSKYSQFNSEAFSFIAEAETQEDAEVRLQSVIILLGDVANLPAIQKWANLMKEWITNKFTEPEPEELPDGDSEEGDTPARSGGAVVEPAAADTEEPGEDATPEELDLPGLQT